MLELMIQYAICDEYKIQTYQKRQYPLKLIFDELKALILIFRKFVRAIFHLLLR